MNLLRLSSAGVTSAPSTTMKRKQLTAAEMEAELAKLDFMPEAQGKKRADALLKNLLASPPDPCTPKPKRKRAKSAKPAK